MLVPRPPFRRRTIAFWSASRSASGSCGQVVERGQLADRLDRVLRHQAGLARLELAVVVLERADRDVRDTFGAHLLDARAQPFVAHRGEVSRRRKARAPSTSAPSSRTRAASVASLVTTRACSRPSTSRTISSSAASRPRRGARTTVTPPRVPEQVVRPGVQDDGHVAVRPRPDVVDQAPGRALAIPPPAVRERCPSRSIASMNQVLEVILITGLKVSGRMADGVINPMRVDTSLLDGINAANGGQVHPPRSSPPGPRPPSPARSSPRRTRRPRRPSRGRTTTRSSPARAPACT